VYVLEMIIPTMKQPIQNISHKPMTLYPIKQHPTLPESKVHYND